MPEDNELGDQDCRADTPEMQFFIPENEEKIMSATLKAFASGSLTPLIKEGLRSTIQSRRLAAGKGELQLEEFKKPPKKKPMTDEEKKRAQTRRLQNREAAQRFRQRQKDMATYLTEKIRRLERTSASLVGEMKKLRCERDELKMMLQDHLVVCSNNIISPSLDHLLNQFTTSSTDSTTFSSSTPQCPDTSDSTSSVFFPDGATCSHINNLSYESLLEGLEANSIEITQDSECLPQDFDESPEMTHEMVISNTDYEMVGGADFSDSDYSDEQRHDSCSSPETVSNYSSVSSETYPLSHTTNELNSALTATFSLVQMDAFCSQPFETVFSTDDILLLDDITS